MCSDQMTLFFIFSPFSKQKTAIVIAESKKYMMMAVELLLFMTGRYRECEWTTLLILYWTADVN